MQRLDGFYEAIRTGNIKVFSNVFTNYCNSLEQPELDKELLGNAFLDGLKNLLKPETELIDLKTDLKDYILKMGQLNKKVATDEIIYGSLVLGLFTTNKYNQKYIETVIKVLEEQGVKYDALVENEIIEIFHERSKGIKKEDKEVLKWGVESGLLDIQYIGSEIIKMLLKNKPENYKKIILSLLD